MLLWLLTLCSFGAGFGSSCPGYCIMNSEPCNVALDEASCGADFRCCMDGTESVAERLHPATQNRFDSDVPFEISTEEMEYSTPVGSVEDMGSETMSTEYQPFYSSWAETPEKFAFSQGVVCPGACIPQVYSQYCEFMIPDDHLCQSGSLCCISKEQAEKMKAGLEYSLEGETNPERTSYSSIPQSSHYESQLYCPGQCVSPYHTMYCDRIMSNYFCPSNLKCCNNSTYGMDVLKECTGYCIPNNLKSHCRSPLKLIFTSNCRQGTTCCEQPFESASQSEDGSSFEMLNRLAKDDQGNIYTIDQDGGATPLPELTRRDHLHNRYTLITELDQDDGTKISFFTDKSERVYFQKNAETSQIPDENERTSPPLGMPDTNVHIPQENLQHTDHPIPDDMEHIEESLKDFIIPEDGEVSSAAETTLLLENRELRPLCPGSCLSYFLRFTCFGSVAVYDGFSCEDGKTICCTSTEAIKEHEEFLRKSSPLPRTPNTILERNFPLCGVKGHKELGVDGRASLPGEWCWQVAIISSSKQYLCAGALVDRSWVITAAHCISGSIRDGQSLSVAAGVMDLSDPSTHKNAQSRNVISSFIHNNHNRVSLDNDIALLKLENPFTLGLDVCVVCLPDSLSKPTEGMKCTVSGYGFPSEGGAMSLKTRAATVDIVDDTDCMANITNALSIVYLLPSSSFCAGNGSSCQGDAGSPLVCESNGIYELYGILSWTLECGREDVPSVYVNVPSEMSWIHRIVTKLPEHGSH